MANENLVAAEQLLLTSVESMFGTLLKKEEPVIVNEAIARIKTRIDSRAAPMAKNDRDHGWSPTRIGDERNDYDGPGGIQGKRIDNQWFIFAHKLGGTLADVGFRDRFSPLLTPLVLAKVKDQSTPEEIAQACCGTLSDIVETAIRAATGVEA